MSPILPTGTSPTDQITFTVLTGGSPVPDEFRVVQITVDREVNRIPLAIIQVADGDISTGTFAASNSEVFIPGREVEIKAGYHSEEETIFKGIMITHHIRYDRFTGPCLTVECRDKAFRMTVGRKNRTFADSTDSDAISTILADRGMDGTAEETTTVREKILQCDSTDWDFINLRAEAVNKLVFVEDGSVEVKSVSFSGTPVAELSLGSGIIGIEAGMDSRSQFSGITAQSWSPADQEILETDASDPGISQPGNLDPDTLAEVSGLTGLTIRHPGHETGEEIQSLADGALTRSRLARNQGRVTVQGNADLKPGTLITLSGLGDRFNGDAYVTGIRHVIKGGNWLTHTRFGMEPEPFSVKFRHNIQAPPAAGTVPGIFGLQSGLVTQLQSDPLNEDRIRVRLPMLHDGADGIWARLATLDAGDQRGTVFRPEIGDEVIVGFINNNPHYPVILGMLHSSAKASPAAGSDDNHEKGFVTRSGMKIWFNDDKKSIEISTPGGYQTKLDEDEKALSIEDANGNKLVLNEDGITIESSKDLIIKASGDIKAEGLNIGLKSSAQFKAEGSAGAEISSSASTAVKGSIVQIN